MDRKIRDRIFEEIKQMGKLNKDYIVELIKTFDEKPNVDKLVEQYYKSKADNLMGSFRDENGLRDCYTTRDSQNKTKYIDLSKPELNSDEDIEAIKQKKEKANRQNDAVITKTNVAQKVRKGIIKAKDYSKVLKQELINR